MTNQYQIVTAATQRPAGGCASLCMPWFDEGAVGEGWQMLWGMQCILCGAKPPNKEGVVSHKNQALTMGAGEVRERVYFLRIFALACLILTTFLN